MASMLPRDFMPMEIVNPDIMGEDGEEEEEGVMEVSETEEEMDGSSRNQEGRKEKRKPSIQRELADAIVRLAPLEELRILLKCGANVKDTVTQGLSPLHYAVWQRYPEAAEFLIDEGCDINAKDDIGYTALHLSAEHGYIEMMEVLLKHGAQVNFNIPPEDEDDFPTDAYDEPLRLALKHDHFEAAKVLLEHGANPNTRYFFGSEINLVNPLNTQLLHLLLSYGANPNARDRQGFTPIMKCCRLQQDSSDEMETRDNISGLEVLQHFAQTLMGLEAVLLLISFGANVNARTEARHDYRRNCLYFHSSPTSRASLLNPLNRSVLHYAVLSGSVPIVNLLLKQGARVNFEPEYNKPTPLDLAILKGDVEMVRLIIEHDPNLDASSPIIGSPLHMACSEGIPNRLEILKLLLEKGANPNLVIVGEDNTPIKPALGEYLSSNEDPDVEVVNLFLRYGAEVVMQSQNRDPRGLLNCLPNLTKRPDVLITLLEAAQRFDLAIIKHSSLIDNDQRKIYLKAQKARKNECYHERMQRTEYCLAERRDTYSHQVIHSQWNLSQ
ncbi:ankyrin repeat domain-containing protein 65 isoform X2 [Cherax quadricarinatus]|uniref:ankyrin repeat domain-containing protein 65 isoform X2 n=1 Tax=Cherax quadricarinatus TaxID=27406 RepID=UPI00387E46D4